MAMVRVRGLTASERNVVEWRVVRRILQLWRGRRAMHDRPHDTDIVLGRQANNKSLEVTRRERVVLCARISPASRVYCASSAPSPRHLTCRCSFSMPCRKYSQNTTTSAFSRLASSTARTAPSRFLVSAGNILSALMSSWASARLPGAADSGCVWAIATRMRSTGQSIRGSPEGSGRELDCCRRVWRFSALYGVV